MAERDGDSAFWSKVQREEVPYCGLCDPVTRHVERDDGRVARCPRCHPLADGMLPQDWRCARCHQVIIRTDRELTCDKHRMAEGIRRAYDQARVALPPPSPVTEAGAVTARKLLADRPRPAAPDPEPDDDDYDDGEFPF